jgi:hypothetical protein
MFDQMTIEQMQHRYEQWKAMEKEKYPEWYAKGKYMDLYPIKVLEEGGSHIWRKPHPFITKWQNELKSIIGKESFDIWIKYTNWKIVKHYPKEKTILLIECPIRAYVDLLPQSIRKKIEHYTDMNVLFVGVEVSHVE